MPYICITNQNTERSLGLVGVSRELVSHVPVAFGSLLSTVGVIYFRLRFRSYMQAYKALLLLSSDVFASRTTLVYLCRPDVHAESI